MAEPRNDCRPTLRHLKSAGIRIKNTEDFSVLAQADDGIRRFFERRQDDPRGGEDAERVRQIRSRPAFKLTSGRFRGATWFDQNHPPQDVVWLLGLELHDERAKGSTDAYDILGNLDKNGELFPQAIDYKRLELDRRRWDTEHFAADAQRDAVDLVKELFEHDRADRKLAEIPVRSSLEKDDLWIAYFSVSETPVQGPRSRLPFPLTSERFDLLRAAVERAIEAETGEEALSDTSPQRKPLALGQGRQFFVMFNMPSDAGLHR